MWKTSRINSNKVLSVPFRSPASRGGGFTLIEILVVVVVVGLLATIAVVNMGNGSQLRELENHAQSLYLNLRAASDQAVLDNEEIGLVLGDGGYYMALYDEDKGTWQAGTGPLLERHQLPDWVDLVLVQQGNGEQRQLPASQNNKIHPDLVLFSSGETTPFEIQVKMKKSDKPVYVIKSDGVNGIKWQAPGGDSS